MTDEEIGNLFEKDSWDAAEKLIGKIISYDGRKIRITETEAYGNNDPFCYGVRYGKTAKNSVSFRKGGFVFIYCGMLMFTTGKEDNHPQNVLIRKAEVLDDIKTPCNGPCNLLKHLGEPKELREKLNGERIGVNVKIIDDGMKCENKDPVKRGWFNVEKTKEDIEKRKKKHPEDLTLQKITSSEVERFADIEWRFAMKK